MTKTEAPKPPAVGSPRLSEGLGPVAGFQREYWPGCTEHGGPLYTQLAKRHWQHDECVLLFDVDTVRRMIEAAWCAGYYDAGYTHDSAYAEKQSEQCADSFLGPNVGAKAGPTAGAGADEA